MTPPQRPWWLFSWVLCACSWDLEPGCCSWDVVVAGRVQKRSVTCSSQRRPTVIACLSLGVCKTLQISPAALLPSLSLPALPALVCRAFYPLPILSQATLLSSIQCPWCCLSGCLTPRQIFKHKNNNYVYNHMTVLAIRYKKYIFYTLQHIMGEYWIGGRKKKILG